MVDFDPDFNTWQQLQQDDDEQDEETNLLSEYKDALIATVLDKRTIGTEEDRESRTAAAEGMEKTLKAINDGDVWDVSMLPEEHVEVIRARKPDLYTTLTTKRQEIADQQAAEAARQAEQDRLAQLDEEAHAKELAAAQAKADEERRIRNVEQFLQFDGVEAINPITEKIERVPMVERPNRITGKPEKVFGTPKHLQPVVDAFHTWHSLPGYKRAAFLEELPEVVRDSLSVLYDVEPPLGLDQIKSLKG